METNAVRGLCVAKEWGQRSLLSTNMTTLRNRCSFKMSRNTVSGVFPNIMIIRFPGPVSPRLVFDLIHILAVGVKYWNKLGSRWPAQDSSIQIPRYPRRKITALCLVPRTDICPPVCSNTLPLPRVLVCRHSCITSRPIDIPTALRGMNVGGWALIKGNS